MEKFLTLCVSGAVTGAIYSLVASGLVLSYSATGIFNFAYGGIAFAAAYLYYEFNGALHYHIVPSALLVVFGAAVLCAVGLWQLVRRTPFGMRMREVVDMAFMQGVDDAPTCRSPGVD